MADEQATIFHLEIPLRRPFTTAGGSVGVRSVALVRLGASAPFGWGEAAPYPGQDESIDAVLDAAARTDTALEINAGLPRLDVSTEVMRRAKGRDVTFIITSDAHQASELDRMRWGVRHALRGWLEPERVANTWPRDAEARTLAAYGSKLTPGFVLQAGVGDAGLFTTDAKMVRINQPIEGWASISSSRG